MNTLLRAHRIAWVILAILTLTACTLYRMDVRQGNYIAAETSSKLKIGMTKENVQDLLGTPTLTHFFEQERWDYYYYLRPGNGDPIQEKRISIFFKNNKVDRIIRK